MPRFETSEAKIHALAIILLQDLNAEGSFHSSGGERRRQADLVLRIGRTIAGNAAGELDALGRVDWSLADLSSSIAARAGYKNRDCSKNAG
jgi:hypothetical protein